MKDTALISGITGQAGSYLAEKLLAKGYEVYGIVRRSATTNTKLIDDIIDDIELVQGDITDGGFVSQTVRLIKPKLCFNAAAQSHVGYSFNNPRNTIEVNVLGVLNFLEALRYHSMHTRFLQFSTSEMWGEGADVSANQVVYYNQDSHMKAKSPYGVSKIAAHNLVVNYREAYKLFAMCCIFCNMESERRGLNFVTRKATRSAAEIKLGLRENVGFGNIDSIRDWGYCPDYMDGAIEAILYKEPTEFVFATGEKRTVRDMLKVVFEYAGLGDYSQYVHRDDKYYRPSDLTYLLGDASKAETLLGWTPQTNFEQMIKRMYDFDYKELSETSSF